LPVWQGRHQPQVGAAQAQHVLFLLALRLGHHDHRTVATGIGDQSDADAGVAGRALDDDAAGPEPSLLLGVLDDGECGPILHRAAGIEELRLAVDVATGRLRCRAQANERRIADAVDKV
jgi:hypothetical protein